MDDSANVSYQHNSIEQIVPFCNRTRCGQQQLTDEILRFSQALLQLNGDNRHVLFVLSGLLVLLMQSGFPLVQYGSRKNSASHVLVVFIYHTMIAGIIYWLIGYGIAFGEGLGFVGSKNFAGLNLSADDASHWFFHLTLDATVCSIVVSSMADRGTFVSYVIVTILVSGLIHPFVVHWCWSPFGWLYQNGAMYYRDYAGAGVIHVSAGACATVAVATAGPRSVRSDTVQRKPGHTIPISIVGSFLLIVGYVAIACGTQAGRKVQNLTTSSIVDAITSTVLAANFGGAAYLCCYRLEKCCKNSRREVRPDALVSLSYFLAGSVAGMVSVSAGCDRFPMWASVTVGVIGSLFAFFLHLVVAFFKGEDEIHVVGVHLGAGIWGLIAAPVFEYPDGMIKGEIDTSRMVIAWNLAAGSVILAWSGVLSIVVFVTLKCLKFYSIDYDLKGSDILRQGQTSSPAPSSAENSYFHAYQQSNENGSSIMGYDIPLNVKNQANDRYPTIQRPFGTRNEAFLSESATQL
ncbi:ammonium transporter 3-like isoform X1 [Centruroides sculpturatus]|uniref:ammonium transporter 3-like isoform X1 n=1 Tax=Centruroides sculpturatus TaxID=218467 RepID=UPI000C6DAE56|nr:ammonium transporter 3-like isoform X1 [Centruroides sculpturatus]